MARSPLRVIAPPLVGLALTLWLSAALGPAILSDDSAIALRYAERLASGAGLADNDHERVCGTSSPLWTLMIAGGAGAGLGAEQTAGALARLLSPRSLWPRRVITA